MIISSTSSLLYFWGKEFRTIILKNNLDVNVKSKTTDLICITEMAIVVFCVSVVLIKVSS